MDGKFDISGIRIETPRLILREWTYDDLQDFYRYASVDGVGECAGWRHHQSIDESKRILASFIDGKKTFALQEKSSGRVIGSLGIEYSDIKSLRESDVLKGREIGYVLAKDKWGQGLMTEAVSAVIDYCFANFDWDFITCGHFLQNDRSRRVIEKCGFAFVEENDFNTCMNTVERTRDYVLYRRDRL